jgi:tetratricopeptide (TPR) repeat protein
MRTKLFLIIFLVLGIFLTNNLIGRGVGTSSATFLKIPTTSRIIGLSEAVTAIIDDPSAISVNPAGLGNIDKLHILISHYDWISDIGYEYLAMAYPSFKGIKGEQGVLGLGIAYLHIPSFFNYGEWGEIIENDKLTYNDFAISIGYGQKIKNFVIGNTFKVIHEMVDDISGTTFTIDLGAIYDVKLPPARIAGFNTKGKILKLGLAILNIGLMDIKGYSTPLTIKLGIGSKLAKDFLMNFDFEKPLDNRIRINWGIEYTLIEIISIRAGYRFIGYETDSFTFGLGVGYRFGERLAKIGTAYAPQGPFKSTLNFTAEMKFPGSKPEDITKLAEMYYYQGIYYYTKGDYDKAIQMWKEVLKLIPDHKKALEKIKDAEYLKKLKETEDLK